MFRSLPPEVRRSAKRVYRQFVADPKHPSLRLHELAATRRGQHKPGSRSVSVTMKYRAIYVVEDGVNIWYWIGPHSDYESFTGRK